MDDWSDDDWMEWLESTFEALDTKDVDAFVAKLTPGAEVRFGNGEPVVGRVAIRDAFREFLDAVGSVSHAYSTQLSVDDTLIVETTVTATRHDGTTVVLPSATVFELTEGKADRMQTYIDVAPLFAAGEMPALCRAGETVMA
jgi:ketosteroid isomerase-like protein